MRKHAAANAVNVYVRNPDGGIELEIADNGVGFDPSAMDDTGGMGLNSMRERAEKLGAMLTIQPMPKLVLVNNVRQQQAARSAGADSVLLKGFRAAKFFEIIETLTKERAEQ